VPEFEEVPEVEIPSTEVTPRVPPAAKLNVPAPSTIVPGVAICKNAPLITLKFTVFETVPPDVYVFIALVLLKLTATVPLVLVKVPPVIEKFPNRFKVPVPLVAK